MIINSIAKDFENIIAIDTAKTSFQVYVVNQKINRRRNDKVTRKKFVEHITKLGTGLIFMESCSASQYWAREFEKLGFTVKLIAAQHVKAFLYNKKIKNDAKDAEAIFKCGMQPDTKFVRVKSVEEQTVALLHTLRKGEIKHRVQLCNRIRGVLAEFGIITDKGRNNFDKNMSELRAQCEKEISNLHLKSAIDALFDEYKESLEREDKYTQQILQNRQDELNKLAMSCHGVGEITASAIVAEVGNAKQFKNGREMSAWLGLVPSQHSTGGRSTLVGITKTGNKYIRGLLDQCANSIYRNAKTHLDKGTDNQLDRFALRLKSKGKPAGKIAMALANKIVRILWAVLSSGNEFKSNINFQDKDRDVLCLE